MHPLVEFFDDYDHIEPWSDSWRFRQERQLWLAVMTHQSEFGAIFPTDGVLGAYREVASHPIGNRTLQQIYRAETVTKHDVKARIQIFNEEAAHIWAARFRQPLDVAVATIQFAHIGLTSADVVDNISLVQMRETTKRLCDAVTARIEEVGGLEEALHHHQELVTQYGRLNAALLSFPFRGFKGPVGTQQDLLGLYGEQRLVWDLELRVAAAFDFNPAGVLTNTGQVYPRSIDTDWATMMLQCIGGTQPWHAIANGYYRMITEYSDDQWNEGDVSTSVVRRVALPGIALATAAAIEGIEP